MFDKVKNGVHQVLKRFAVDRFIDAQKQSLNVLDAWRYPVTHQALVLITALNWSYHSSTIAPSFCKHYTHNLMVTCYRTNLISVKVFKERKLANAYEFSRRTTETVTANVGQNSIKTVDGKQRRAGAHRA